MKGLEEAYEKDGQAGVYDFLMKVKYKFTYGFCVQCDVDAPKVEGVCGFCGQSLELEEICSLQEIIQGEYAEGVLTEDDYYQLEKLLGERCLDIIKKCAYRKIKHDAFDLLIKQGKVWSHYHEGNEFVELAKLRNAIRETKWKNT